MPVRATPPPNIYVYRASTSAGVRWRATFGRVSCGVDKVHHCVGNHELYNFGRDVLRVALGLDGRLAHKTPPRPDVLYYGFAPCDGWRVLVL